MDGFFKKVNQKVNLGQCSTPAHPPAQRLPAHRLNAHPPVHCYFKGRTDKPVQKAEILNGTTSSMPFQRMLEYIVFMEN